MPGVVTTTIDPQQQQLPLQLDQHDDQQQQQQQQQQDAWPVTTLRPQQPQQPQQQQQLEEAVSRKLTFTRTDSGDAPAVSGSAVAVAAPVSSSSSSSSSMNSPQRSTTTATIIGGIPCSPVPMPACDSPPNASPASNRLSPFSPTTAAARSKRKREPTRGLDGANSAKFQGGIAFSFPPSPTVADDGTFLNVLCRPSSATSTTTRFDFSSLPPVTEDPALDDMQEQEASEQSESENDEEVQEIMGGSGGSSSLDNNDNTLAYDVMDASSSNFVSTTMTTAASDAAARKTPKMPKAKSPGFPSPLSASFSSSSFSSRKQKQCACCGCTSTPLWRDMGRDRPLCNACGIRWKKYGVVCDVCQYVPCKQERDSRVCKRCNEPIPSKKTRGVALSPAPPKVKKPSAAPLSVGAGAGAVSGSTVQPLRLPKTSSLSSPSRSETSSPVSPLSPTGVASGNSGMSFDAAAIPMADQDQQMQMQQEMADAEAEAGEWQQMQQQQQMQDEPQAAALVEGNIQDDQQMQQQPQQPQQQLDQQQMQQLANDMLIYQHFLLQQHLTQQQQLIHQEI